MAITLSSPTTGATVSGLTNPTYTPTADQAPESNSKQWLITTLGGTQTGVQTHTVSQPFLVKVSRPKVVKSLGIPNPVTGVISNVPKNVYTVLTLKGVLPQASQAYQNQVIRTTIEVPAGSDVADLPNLKAGMSCHAGVLWDQASSLGSTMQTGNI
jgi:hypothetical protein